MKINKGFSTIPNQVKYNKNLSLLSRFILSDIISFNESGHCYASNGYFSELYDVSKRRVEQCMKELFDSQYIYTIYNRAQKRRFISLTPEYMRDYRDQIFKEIEEMKETTPDKTVAIKDLKKLWSD